VNSSRHATSNRLLSTAAWLYVLPRAARGVLILAILGLAGFMVLTALVLALAR
jgi:hypothetical protein